MPRELKQETYEDIAAISAFIRRNAFIYGTDLADRLDAAWKRQMSQSWHHREMEELIAKHEKEVAELKKQTGNAAAMREALEMARDALKSAEKYVYGDPPNGGAIGWDDVWPSEWHNALEAVERALSSPARNCDRYKDAPSAYADFIVPWKLDGHLDDVPTLQDFANWLFAPAAERKGEGDGK